MRALTRSAALAFVMAAIHLLPAALVAQPAVPTYVTVANINGAVTVSWTGIANQPVSYRVVRALGATGFGADLTAPLPAGVTSFVDVTAQPGATYFYTIVAVYPRGITGASDPVQYPTLLRAPIGMKNPAITLAAPPVPITRDLVLEQSVSMRRQSLSAALQPSARDKLDQAGQAVLARLASGSEGTDPVELAQQEVAGRFKGLTQDQTDLLSLYVAADLARLLASPDELSEMSEPQSMRLRAFMERHSRFLDALNDLLNKMSSTSAGIIQNLK